MQENTEAWDLQVTIVLPETIPGTRDRFREALRAALVEKYADFEARFRRQLSAAIGRDWEEALPLETWQFEAANVDEINVSSRADARQRNYISVPDAQLWEFLSVGLVGDLDVYFDGPLEMNVLELRVLLTLQVREALPEEEIVTFRCEQESVEYVMLRVSCSRPGTESKFIRAPSCISSDDLAVFLREVFHVAPEVRAQVALKTPETEPERLARLQSPVPLYRYLSWAGAVPTEISPASDLASRFEAALDLRDSS